MIAVACECEHLLGMGLDNLTDSEAALLRGRGKDELEVESKQRDRYVMLCRMDV